MILSVVISLFFCQVLGEPIAGGHFQKIHRHPWLASIQREDRHKCGGSIIASTIILTAAHCARHPITSYVVRVGSSRTDSGGTWHNVVAIRQHKNFNMTGRLVHEIINDVALMKVSPPIKFDTNTTQIQLADKDYSVPVGTTVNIAGWGSTSYGGWPSYELRSVKLRIVDSGECARAYGDHTGTRIASQHQICAYGFRSGFCKGDSGSPLVSEDGIQIGIVFGRTDCGDYRYPGVYQNVSYYRDWIDENMKNLLSC